MDLTSNLDVHTLYEFKMLYVNFSFIYLIMDLYPAIKKKHMKFPFNYLCFSVGIKGVIRKFLTMKFENLHMSKVYVIRLSFFLTLRSIITFESIAFKIKAILQNLKERVT